MNLLTWIILGAIAGWIASILTHNNRAMGKILNLIVGIIGATLGGWIYHLFGKEGVTGLNMHSFGVAIVGSVVFLVIFKLIRHKKS